MDHKGIMIGIGIAVLLVLACSLVPAGHPLVAVVLIPVGARALFEFNALLAPRSARGSDRWDLGRGIVFLLAAWGVERYGWTEATTWGALFFVCATVLIEALLRTDRASWSRTIGHRLTGQIYVIVLWSFVLRVFVSGDPGQALWPGLFLLMMVKGADAGAYFVGSRIGRHKLFPLVSPRKSWEGVGGAVLVACIAALTWSVVTGGRIGSIPLPLHHALMLGLIPPSAGVAGDLVESRFKREVSAKDSADAIYGMGGVLGMVDSLLFAAPVFYVYIHWFLNP